MTRPRKSIEPTLAVRAVRTFQADKAVYAFFIAGADLLKIAEISRVRRDPRVNTPRAALARHLFAVHDARVQRPGRYENVAIPGRPGEYANPNDAGGVCRETTLARRGHSERGTAASRRHWSLQRPAGTGHQLG